MQSAPNTSVDLDTGTGQLRGFTVLPSLDIPLTDTLASRITYHVLNLSRHLQIPHPGLLVNSTLPPRTWSINIGCL